MDPPSAQAMTADPSVIDAAVRFCDDVLASPTIELLCPFESNVKWGEFFVMWRSRTVTIPISNPAGAKVLSIVIEVPEYDVFHGSIVTAEGVCVARMSQRICQRILTNPAGIATKNQLPVPIEWDSAYFGEVKVRMKRFNCFDQSSVWPDVIARGPGGSIILDMADRHPTKVKCNKAGCFGAFFGFLPGVICACFALCYPGEFHIKDSAGEKVGGFETPVSDPKKKKGVLHFEGMTSEQRRLALAAVMFIEGARASAKPKLEGYVKTL